MTTDIQRSPDASAPLLIILIVMLCSVTGCYSGGPVNHIVSGVVTKVHDGDSIHITPSGEKRVVIRLAAIDAPEIKQTHGIQSRDHLRRLILSKQVTAKCNKLDKYQRQVCVVIHDGKDINLKMLEAGQAWYYESFKNEQSRSDQIAYRKAARSANKNKLGLWQDTKAIPPWEYRALQNK